MKHHFSTGYVSFREYIPMKATSTLKEKEQKGIFIASLFWKHHGSFHVLEVFGSIFLVG